MKIALAIFGLFMSSAAFAQTGEQRLAIENIVSAHALAKKCPSWEADSSEIGKIMRANGFAAGDFTGDGRFAPYTFEVAATLAIEFSDVEPEEACIVALAIFGPKGQNVPNLMKRKR